MAERNQYFERTHTHDGNGSAQIDCADLANVNALVPAGIFVPYAGATAPTGWMLCQGQSLLINEYPALYAAIGTTWGSADSSHFSIPDMRAIYLKGAGVTDRAAGKDAKGNFYGTAAKSPSVLGTYYTDRAQGHWHGTRWFASSAGTAHYSQAIVNPSAEINDDAGGTTKATGLIEDAVNAYGVPRAGFTTEPQSAAANWIIKT